MTETALVSGAGLGLRRALLGPLTDVPPGAVDFMEIAPENWIGLGGRFSRQLQGFAERYPLVCHGLSLSIGAQDLLDFDLLKAIKNFIADYDIRCYSEHLSYCSHEGHLYDLLPIPFTEEGVRHTAARIRQVQDFLGQRIALENVSYYAAPDQGMTESEFINAVLDEGDCDLLLDVNNIYVNSINHGYDPSEFLRSMPGHRIAYIHIAGHYKEAEDLRVDTHGADVIEPVWALLDLAYSCFGPLPTLLERDFNFPPIAELLGEVGRVRRAQGQSAPLAELQFTEA